MPRARDNWHAKTFFGLHYDLHASRTDTELGRETTYEQIRAELEKARPDFVQYDCKGHPGYTGYPTKVGTPSPGIRKDALKIWRQVTRDLGIPLSVHYSGTWDTVAQEQHPQWARMNADGTPVDNSLCANKGYVEELMIPQMLEIIREYDVDGFWVDGDCWAAHPCWCDTCRRLFTERSGIAEIPTERGQPHWDQWMAFQRCSFERYVNKYAEAVHAAKPTCLVCSNWMYSLRQPDEVVANVDYLSGDFTPSFGWVTALVESKVLDAREMTWDLMAWSFLQTGGGAWATKTAVHLCQELSVVMANGGNAFIYDVPKRSGRLVPWHQDMLAEVARFCRKRKAVCQGTRSVPQVALLHSQSHFYAHNNSIYGTAEATLPLEGALHALLESHFHVDVLNEDRLLARMEEYPVVVVAEQTHLPRDLVKRLGEWVRDGGRLVLSGPEAAKVFQDLCGVKPAGRARTEATWVPAEGGAVPVAGPWQPVKLEGARALASLLNSQEPDRDALPFPAATLREVGKGRVALIPGPAFEAYARTHYPRLRSFLGQVVGAAASKLAVEADAPPSVHLTLRRKGGKLLVNLYNLSALPALGPSNHMVEQVPVVGPVTVRVRCPQAPEKVSLAPDRGGLWWEHKAGVLEARIEGLHIHNVLVIE